MSEGVVTNLFVYQEKGQAGIQVAHADCVKDVGMLGDIHARGGDRQITLQDSNLKKWMLKQPQRGLCFEKFKENITISGLDFRSLKPGCVLRVGTVELQITYQNKKCYPKECIIYEKVNPCPVPGGCLFAAVLCSGSIFSGDKAALLPQQDTSGSD